MFNVSKMLHIYFDGLEKLSKLWFDHPYNKYHFSTISTIPRGSECTGNLTVFEPCYTLDIKGIINGDVTRTKSVDSVNSFKHSIINIFGRVNGNIEGFDTVIVNGGTVEGIIKTDYCQLSNNGRVTGIIESGEIDIDDWSTYERRDLKDE